MAKKLLWLDLKGPCGDLKVYVKRKLKGGCLGLYYSDIGVMEIAEGPVDSMKMTLFHELLHGALRPYSGDVRAALLGSSKRKREELVVGGIEPFLYDILNRNSLLHIPNPPKFKRRKKKH